MKIVIFTGVKNRCMLHGRIFIMLFTLSGLSVLIDVECDPKIIVHNVLKTFGEYMRETFKICKLLRWLFD